MTGLTREDLHPAAHGSATSILLSTRGKRASIVTDFGGNQMARQGRGGPVLAPQVVKPALTPGPGECFALMVLPFVTVWASFGDSALRGRRSLFILLALVCVGIDGVNPSRAVLGMLILFGVMGYGMRPWGDPVAPGAGDCAGRLGDAGVYPDLCDPAGCFGGVPGGADAVGAAGDAD